MSKSGLVMRHSYAKVIQDRELQDAAQFEADLMGPESKTSRAFCFGDPAFGVTVELRLPSAAKT